MASQHPKDQSDLDGIVHFQIAEEYASVYTSYLELSKNFDELKTENDLLKKTLDDYKQNTIPTSDFNRARSDLKTAMDDIALYTERERKHTEYIFQLETRISQLEAKSASSSNQEDPSEIDQLKSKINALEIRLKSSQEQINELTKSHSSNLAKMIESISQTPEAQPIRLDSDSTPLIEQLATLKSQLEDAKEENKRLCQSISSEIDAHTRVSSALRDLQSEFIRYTEEAEAKSAEDSSILTSLQSMLRCGPKSNLIRATQALISNQSRIPQNSMPIDASQKISELSALVVKLKSENQVLSGRLNSPEVRPESDASSTASKEIDELRARNAELEDQVNSLQGEEIPSDEVMKLELEAIKAERDIYKQKAAVNPEQQFAAADMIVLKQRADELEEQKRALELRNEELLRDAEKIKEECTPETSKKLSELLNWISNHYNLLKMDSPLLGSIRDSFGLLCEFPIDEEKIKKAIDSLDEFVVESTQNFDAILSQAIRTGVDQLKKDEDGLSRIFDAVDVLSGRLAQLQEKVNQRPFKKETKAPAGILLSKPKIPLMRVSNGAFSHSKVTFRSSPANMQPPPLKGPI